MIPPPVKLAMDILNKKIDCQEPEHTNAPRIKIVDKSKIEEKKQRFHIPWGYSQLHLFENALTRGLYGNPYGVDFHK